MRVLKWLTLSLFAYVAVVFTVRVDWAEVLQRTVAPRFDLSSAAIVMIVAVFGTTISPYLFFWQSSEEVEDVEADPDAGAGGPSRSGPEGTSPYRVGHLCGDGFLQPNRVLHYFDHGGYT